MTTLIDHIRPASALSKLNFWVAALARVRDSRGLATAATPRSSPEDALAVGLFMLTVSNRERESELYPRMAEIRGHRLHLPRDVRDKLREYQNTNPVFIRGTALPSVGHSPV
jgi:hypothetical protein